MRDRRFDITGNYLHGREGKCLGMSLYQLKCAVLQHDFYSRLRSVQGRDVAIDIRTVE